MLRSLVGSEMCIRDSVKTVFMKIVNIAQEKYDVERFLRINGIENEAEVLSLIHI